MTYVCSRCKGDKPIEDFFPNKSNRGCTYLCRLCINECGRERRRRNPLKAKEQETAIHNKRRDAGKVAQYVAMRRQTDPAFKLVGVLRIRILRALQGKDKSAKTVELLGCSINELKLHLQSQFTAGMTWENQGTWHIDHKMPCSSFDLNDPEQQRACFHYSNLQPLWALDNILKGSKLPTD